MCTPDLIRCLDCNPSALGGVGSICSSETVREDRALLLLPLFGWHLVLGRGLATLAFLMRNTGAVVEKGAVLSDDQGHFWKHEH